MNSKNIKENVYKEPEQNHSIPEPNTGTEQILQQYSPMLQGPEINGFMQMNMRNNTLTVDKVTGLTTITSGRLKLYIEEFHKELNTFTPSMQKLFICSLIALTSQNDYRSDKEPNTLVSIPLRKAYMALCKIPDTKSSTDKTRREVKADQKALYDISIEISGGGTMRLYSHQDFDRGNIVLRFSPELARYLIHAYVMFFPNNLLTLDNRNPNALKIGYKLALHHGLDNNVKKGTADIISVKKLLEIMDIPSYEEVMASDRHVDYKIIEPLRRSLDSLTDSRVITSWEYCNSKGTPLTDEQLGLIDGGGLKQKGFTYAVFSKSYIHFKMLDAPDQTQRLKAKAQTRKTTTSKRPYKKKTV
jgi:hypothetical protein